MFTAIVLICNIDLANATECGTGMSTSFYRTEAQCVADVENKAAAGAWRTDDTKTGINYDAIQYYCVEWKAGSKI